MPFFTVIRLLSQNLGIFSWVANITNKNSIDLVLPEIAGTVIGRTLIKKSNQIRFLCIYGAFNRPDF